MHNKIVFLVVVTALIAAPVADVRAEYMEPQVQESRAQDCHVIDVDASRDSFYEPVHETPTREQQTRADDDPRVQSCITEAIVQKYCLQ